MIILPKGYRMAVGSTPQTIVSIQRALVGAQTMTRVNAGKEHGLKPGDEIHLNITWANSDATFNKLYGNNGNWTVVATGRAGIWWNKDDYFIIAPKYQSGDQVTGTWQLASSYVPKVEPKPDTGGTPDNPDNKGTNNNTPDTPTDEKPKTNIILWVAGGLVLLGGALLIWKKTRK